MGKLVDIHAHLDHAWLAEDLDQVIERAKKEGVCMILTAGIDPESNRKTLELASKYDIVKASCGIYPPSALAKEKDENSTEIPVLDLNAEIEFLKKHKDQIWAIGEVGMDFDQTDDYAEQKELFEKMIDLAIEWDKALIVHSRKAELDVIETLEEKGAKKVVMHCFGGNKKMIKRIEENGWMLSIPPNIVRSSHFQMIAKEVSMAQLLTETDAPFLGPLREERNESANVALTIKAIAEIKGMDPLEVENAVFMNMQKLG